MAKTLNTTKDKLVGLLNATDAVPASKLASDGAKHLGFRKAVKKHLKEYTDAKAEAQGKFRDEQRVLQDKLNPIQEKLAKLEAPKTPEQQAEKDKLQEKQNKLNQEFQKFITEVNDKLGKLSEDLKVQKVEIVFDNEEFLFEERVMKDNMATVFTAGEDKLNADHAEAVFDLLDSAK